MDILVTLVVGMFFGTGVGVIIHCLMIGSVIRGKDETIATLQKQIQLLGGEVGIEASLQQVGRLGLRNENSKAANVA